MTIFDEKKASAATRFVSLLPRTSDGLPMELIDWQIEPIRQFYGTLTENEDGERVRQYQYLYFELTKKQGKTELAAALGVMHLLDQSEINGEIYIVAADKPNAGICFDAAVYKIRHTPSLLRLEAKGVIKIRESTREIRYAPTGAKLKVLSSEAYTKHGYKPSVVIFDELHAQPNRDLWDVMTFGAGDARRQPVWIVLTTAGDDPDRRSIGWEIHRKAVNIRNARLLRDALAQGRTVCELPFVGAADEQDAKSEAEQILEQDDPSWLVVLYGLSALYSDDEDKIAAANIYDEALWIACNPSIGKTVKLSTIRAEAREAKKSEAQERLFRWLRLNQWIAVKTVGWIPLTIYDKTQWNHEVSLLRGKRCYGGLDLSSTTDMTGYSLYFPVQPGLDCGVLLRYAWLPNSDIEIRERQDRANYRDWARAGFMSLCDGDTIDYEAVIDQIVSDSDTYQIVMLGTDPYLSRTITQRLAAAEITCVEIPQTIAGMWPAMWEMEKSMRKHELLHVHNTAARYCWGNVRCRSDGNGNLKPMKNLSRGRIDMLIADINAVATKLIDDQRTRDLAEALEERYEM